MDQMSTVYISALRYIRQCEMGHHPVHELVLVPLHRHRTRISAPNERISLGKNGMFNNILQYG